MAERSNVVGPFIQRTDLTCTACWQPMTVAEFLGRKAEAVLFCDGCGRKAVHCQCPPPPGHPWATSR